MLRISKTLFLILVIILIYPFFSFANNLSITNITLLERDTTSKTLEIKFDISWENSWRTKINHDAAWFTIRLHDPASDPTDKRLCQLTASGVNPTGFSSGSNPALKLFIPADKRGAFLRPASYAKTGPVASTGVQVKVDYSSCSFSASDNVYASVIGIEMVFIPQGAFYAGDKNTSVASFFQGSSDADPWYITSESPLTASDLPSDSYYYASNGNVGEDITGATFTLSDNFPKGYGAFYAMKYEITEGQWVEFINSLGSEQARANHDLTDGAHKNTDAVKFRNTISCSGVPLVCSSEKPSRALSYISWQDLLAYLDWMALRPMTELEFEKMARGPLLSLPGEFPWGTAIIAPAATISGSNEDGTETIVNPGANAHYNSTTLTGGDTGNGVDYQQGPLRVGIFAQSLSSREASGGGYYGVMELSGNVKERVVTVGNLAGRSFTGKNGDGLLSTASGYEGNALEGDWPGTDIISDYGVTGADGSGFRGGGWDDQASGARLRISDRQGAAYTSTSAYADSGGRGVRTYDVE